MDTWDRQSGPNFGGHSPVKRQDRILSLQSPDDDHEWVRWFAPAREYRGKIWSYGLEQWVEEPRK